MTLKCFLVHSVFFLLSLERCSWICKVCELSMFAEALLCSEVRLSIVGMDSKNLSGTRENNFRGCVENSMLGVCGIKLPMRQLLKPINKANGSLKPIRHRSKVEHNRKNVCSAVLPFAYLKAKTTNHLGYSFRFLRLLPVQLSQKIVCHQEKITCWGCLLRWASVSRKWQCIFWIQLLICQASLLTGMFYVPTWWQLLLIKQTLCKVPHFQQPARLFEEVTPAHAHGKLTSSEWLLFSVRSFFIAGWLSTERQFAGHSLQVKMNWRQDSFYMKDTHIKMKKFNISFQGWGTSTLFILKEESNRVSSSLKKIPCRIYSWMRLFYLVSKTCTRVSSRVRKLSSCQESSWI